MEMETLKFKFLGYLEKYEEYIMLRQEMKQYDGCSKMFWSTQITCNKNNK